MSYTDAHSRVMKDGAGVHNREARRGRFNRI